MAFYLVSAVPRQELMEDLSARLQRDEFTPLRPFGPTLSRSLKAARQTRDGGVLPSALGGRTDIPEPRSNVRF